MRALRLIYTITVAILGFATVAKAGSVQVVHAFNGNDQNGYQPVAPLTKLGPYLYGTVYQPGPDESGGIIYRLSKDGRYKVVHRFTNGRGGLFPATGLTALNGVLYGVTNAGGQNQVGVIYSLSPTGHFNVIHSLVLQEGDFPSGRLLAINGTLYGVLASGGSQGKGVVFSVTPDGTYSVLHSFSGGATDGEYPRGTLLVDDGVLYGVTRQGGANGYGTAYSLTFAGQIKLLHSFSNDANGLYPESGLMKLGNELFGTTGSTGESGGTLYQITTSGQFDLVHTFDGGDDGYLPAGDLTLMDGTLYGTTVEGGNNNNGIIFSYNRSGGYALADYLLNANVGGSEPNGGLAPYAGTLFGTTSTGGPGGGGVIFSATP